VRSLPLSPGTFGTSGVGIIGGDEFGYNWQSGQFVLGFEADISGSTISGSELLSGASVVVGFPANTVGVSGSANAKVDYLGTVRGRAGYLLTPPLLAYVTGGLAYGGASSNTTLAEQVVGPCSCGSFPAVAGSTSTARAGSTIGGGVEYMFAPHWTVKAEYLYYDLGSVTYALPPDRADNGGGHSVLQGDRCVARRLHRQCRTGRRELRVLICEAAAVRVPATELRALAMELYRL
jgi:outer membrane immunogenic protein